MPTLLLEDKFTDLSAWTAASGGSPTIVTDPVFSPPSGGNALKIDALAEFIQWPVPDVGITRLVVALWWRVEDWPASATRAWKIDAGPTEGWVRLRSNGETQLGSDGTPTISGFFGSQVMTFGIYRWVQLMYDVGSDPWEMRYRQENGVVVSGTGSAAASNLNPALVTLGETGGVGTATTQYFGHVKIGEAADDDDWWTEPSRKQSLYMRRPAIGMR